MYAGAPAFGSTSYADYLAAEWSKYYDAAMAAANHAEENKKAAAERLAAASVRPSSRTMKNELAAAKKGLQQAEALASEAAELAAHFTVLLIAVGPTGGAMVMGAGMVSPDIISTVRAAWPSRQHPGRASNDA